MSMLIDMSFESILFYPINPTLFLLISLGLVLVNLLVRFSDDEESRMNESATSDPLSQLGLAILATRQKSLAPLRKNYNSERGRFYYPLGFYWYCKQILENAKVLENLFRPKNSTLQSLFADSKINLDTFIVFVKSISGIIMPACIEFVSIPIIVMSMGTTVLSMICTLAFVSIVDSLFARSFYSVSTRNAGLFVYSFYPLIWILNNNLTKNTLFHGFTGYLIYIIIFLQFLLLFQISQRYWQNFIALAFAMAIILPHTGLTIVSLFILSIFVLINLPLTDYAGLVYAHICHRIHDDRWSRRTYGEYRYKLIGKLDPAKLKDLINCAFKFSYMREGFGFSPFYKQNAMSLFVAFRIYIYGSCILFLLGPSHEGLYNFSILKSIIFATIFPTLLILLRPFQSYGAGEVYFFANLPFSYLGVFLLINEAYFDLENQSISLSIIILLSVFDAIASIAVFVKQRMTEFSNLCRKGLLFSKGDSFESIILSGANLEIIKLMQFLERTISCLPSEMLPLTLTAHGIHLLSITDLFEAKVRNKNGKALIISTFKMINNGQYGFQDDWENGFFMSQETMFNKLKSDLLLFDTSKPFSNILLKKHPTLLRSNLVKVKFGCIVLVSFNPIFNQYLIKYNSKK